ncbi:MAG: hypothetical protein WBB29_08590, partial [Geitlerinemataceae cyanobacterium]
MLTTVIWWGWIAFCIVVAIVLIGFYLRGAFRDRLRYKVIDAPSPDTPYFPYCLASTTNSSIVNSTITDFWNEPNEIQQARTDA